MFYTLTLKMQKKSSGQHLNHYNYFKKILIAFQKENNENPKSDYKRLYPAIFAIGDFVHYVFFSTSLDYLNRLQSDLHGMILQSDTSSISSAFCFEYGEIQKLK